MDTFLVRISTIVNIIQYGQANIGRQNEFPGQDAWVEILLLAGIDDESRSLMPENIEMLSSMAICNWLARKNEKLYFEGIYGHDYSAIEYDNFFAKQALGWNDEELSYMEEDTWLEDGENQNPALAQLKTVHEDLPLIRSGFPITFTPEEQSLSWEAELSTHDADGMGCD